MCIITIEELYNEASHFRKAIETAKDEGEFKPKPYKAERMNGFPIDCCDDTSDLFAHYLFSKFKLVTERVDGSYYNNELNCTCYHSWLLVNNLIVDLTGDQFDSSSSLKIKAPKVYVGYIDDFHRQFEEVRNVKSCGIDSLGSGCHERMYGLYSAIMNYMS